MRLRILIVTESFLPHVNGVTNSVLRILEHLRKEGHEALVIAPESVGGISDYAGYRIKRVASLEMKGMLPVGFPAKTMEPLIDGFSPDVIHLASPFFLGNYAAKIAEHLQIPTLSIYQTDIAGFARHYGLTMAHDSLKKWVAKIHSRTTRTLAPSNWSVKDLEKSGVPQVFLWQRGIDSQRFSPEKKDAALHRELLGTRQDRTLVGYVGRLANEKCVDDLATLDSRDDIQLVIVGDGPAKNRLERVLPNARFVGYQSGDDLARYYATLDIFVHTGRHETFCQSIQEALASGVPVIAPNSGGPIDLINHGSNGYLIETSNPLDLNSSIDDMIKQLYSSSMSQAARESVLHRSWDVINQQLIAHYRELALSNKRLESEQVA